MNRPISLILSLLNYKMYSTGCAILISLCPHVNSFSPHITL